MNNGKPKDEKTPSTVKFKFSTPIPRGNFKGTNLPDYQPGETHELSVKVAKNYQKNGWGKIVD